MAPLNARGGLARRGKAGNGRVVEHAHHFSLAGALITPKAEVVSVLDDAPIPGLYAAGEATSGVHGAMRLARVGCAILDCCVFGMLAGRNVMAKKV